MKIKPDVSVDVLLIISSLQAMMLATYKLPFTERSLPTDNRPLNDASPDKKMRLLNDVSVAKLLCAPVNSTLFI